MAFYVKLSFILVFIFCILSFLSGCSEPDVIEPVRTFSPVTTPPPPREEPEPECNHFWKDPDCQTPSTCFDCDEVQGSTLEHVWTVENYQEASQCVMCGETNGEPLEPLFSRHGLRVNTTAGRAFKYMTITNPEPEEPTVGIASLLYIDFFESDTDYPAKDGYEYIVARFMITFEEDNAREHGFQFMTGQLDFFGFDPNEAAIGHEDLRDSDIDGFKVASRTLNYFGEDFEYFIRYRLILSELVGDIWYVVFEYAFLVPAGYDGIIVYISNAKNWSESTSRVISDNFDYDTLFFRLRRQTL
jgi:hypothetical protein